MATRKGVGFIFSYNENWIAGSYYILNIIHALNTLPDVNKPNVSILSIKKEDFELVKKETNYPYIKYEKFPRDLTLIERGFNKLSRTLLKKLIFKNSSKLKDLQFVYPNYHHLIDNKNIKKVYWIPDFQEEFLPQYFSKEEISRRKKNQKNISKNADIVVFSSKDAQNHYNTLYPQSKPVQHVLQFAVTHPNLENVDFKNINYKYHLPEQYFFAPNQFWAHKNQLLILKAIKTLKDNGVNIYVAFSGKENDYRNKDYMNTLKSFITENKLEHNIKFLGFLDRADQLTLMKKSIAIVQPSLFEGWSTVVEDSKAINKYILLSDLEVHKEQISTNCTFFGRDNYTELADNLKKIWKNPKNIEKPLNYNKNIYNFGLNFTKLIEK